MRLYYVPQSRARRPRWMLEELEIPYELVRLDAAKGETRSAEHLARHPLGHVPVLEDGETRLFESAAICLYLAERFPERGLIPPPGTPERGLVYQWLFYGVTELEPPLVALSAQRKKAEAERDPAVMDAARAQYARAAAALDQVLRHQQWLVGDHFSVADVVCGWILPWARAVSAGADLPALDAYAARIRERPAWRRATAD